MWCVARSVTSDHPVVEAATVNQESRIGISPMPFVPGSRIIPRCDTCAKGNGRCRAKGLMNLFCTKNQLKVARQKWRERSAKSSSLEVLLPSARLYLTSNQIPPTNHILPRQWFNLEPLSKCSSCVSSQIETHNAPAKGFFEKRRWRRG